MTTVELTMREASSQDVTRLAQWNHQLQVDEGSNQHTVENLYARLERWLAGLYSAHIFESDGVPIGYALHRPTDPDLKGPDSVYVRQFFIIQSHRQRGLGTRAFALLKAQVAPTRPIALEALTRNNVGNAFWQAQGFTPYSTLYLLRPNENSQ